MLSPSQVRSFMDCQARWWFKHGLRYPDPSTGKMALGRAVHAALGENFAQKIESCEDLPFAGVIALFRDAWAFEREQTEFRDDEDPAELAACGETLVAKYLDEVAPLIMPAAVELRVEGEIAGVRVQGWVDVLDIHGRIIDIKTSARRPGCIDQECRFQIATYVQLTPGASGEARIDTLVKTKTPGLVTQDFRVTEQDLFATRQLYRLAQQAMRSELYMPNRVSITCSRRNCSFWRHCEREWGGEVPET
jgi:CRISPR/Cas system-associated exonuclease Cas4 (RecB family)